MENGMSREGNLVRGDRKVGRRPRGVTLIAILLFLYAAAHVGLIVLAVVNPETLRTSDWKRNSDTAWELAYVTPLRIGLAIVLAGGILNLRQWARKGVIFFAGLSVLGRTSLLMRPVSTRAPLTYAQEIEILACILLIGYLVSSRVSDAFELVPQSDD